MAERYEVVIDFAKYKGKTLRLNNLRPKNNIEFPTTGVVMEFQVGTEPPETTAHNSTVPGTILDDNPECMTLVPDGSTRRRTFEFKRTNGHWTIDGKTGSTSSTATSRPSSPIPPEATSSCGR